MSSYALKKMYLTNSVSYHRIIIIQSNANKTVRNNIILFFKIFSVENQINYFNKRLKIYERASEKQISRFLSNQVLRDTSVVMTIGIINYVLSYTASSLIVGFGNYKKKSVVTVSVSKPSCPLLPATRTTCSHGPLETRPDFPHDVIRRGRRQVVAAAAATAGSRWINYHYYTVINTARRVL